MSLETTLIALTQAMGSDVKKLTLAQGQLSSLNTTTKTSLVAAINELMGLMGNAGAQIDDTAIDGNTAVTWSANKIFDSIAEARAALKNEILGGAGAALDTLNELAAALGNNPSFATTIATELANRLRFDAEQTLTNAQQVQARANIAAASAAALATLTTGLGNFDRDFVADYNTAKA